MGGASPSTRTNKAPTREEAIQWQMEDARRAGERLPRWKAAQTPLANFSEARRVQRKSEEHAQAHRQLHRRLYDPSDDAGQAFGEICDAAVRLRRSLGELSDEAAQALRENYAKSLETTFQGLRMFPKGPGRTKKVKTNRTRDCVHGAARDLRQAAKRLEEAKALVFSLWTKSRDWPISAFDLGQFLRGIAMCLDEGLEKPNYAFKVQARHYLPFVVNRIKKETGRPHHRQMAILIGAVYGDPKFSEADLKMLLSPRRSRKK